MNPHQKPQEDVVVTQEDRGAAGLCDPANRVDYKEGKLDSSVLIQAFARHWLAGYEAGRRDMREGWVLVPREPTQAMCVAGWRKGDEFNVHMGNGGAARIWEAMLGAAPTEPLGGEG